MKHLNVVYVYLQGKTIIHSKRLKMYQTNCLGHTKTMILNWAIDYSDGFKILLFVSEYFHFLIRPQQSITSKPMILINSAYSTASWNLQTPAINRSEIYFYLKQTLFIEYRNRH